MDQYTFEGTTYNVTPDRLEEFKQKFPQATILGGDVESKTGIQSYDVKQDAMAYAASTNVSTFFDRIFEEESNKGIEKVKETDKKQPSYYGFKANLQALGMGDNVVTDFAAENISEMYRSLFEIGGSQAKSTVAGWNVMNNEQFSTDEDFTALIDAASNMPEQTDAVKKYSSRYEQIKEKDGGVMAFKVSKCRTCRNKPPRGS